MEDLAGQQLVQMQDTLIQVQKLEKSFAGVSVLRGVELSVARGKLVSIIGRSGCGKSTLLRCLNCLEIFDRGQVEIAGITLSRPATPTCTEEEFQQRAHVVRGKVGIVFQSFNLFPHRTVLENVALAPRVVKGMSRGAAEEKARDLLAKVGLAEFVDRYPAHLSGGQQQRAAIARALAMSPEVMLYDEPTSALDPELVDEVLEVMRALNREGMTQVVVTHELRFARDASDLVLYMEDGRIVECAPPDRIFGHPHDERTRQYLKRFL
jgi:polar amino acid transport system ATP-binding protein